MMWLSMKQRRVNRWGEWREWFAWYPVKVGDEWGNLNSRYAWVWLVHVEKRVQYWNSFHWFVYRLIQDWDQD